MPSSPVEIANMALVLMGSSRISTLDGSDDKSATINLLFQPLLDIITEDQAADWTFAIHRQTLAASAETNLTPYAYMYQRPVDPKCLRAICLVDSYGYDLSKADYPFKPEGSYLYTDVESTALKYVRQITDVTMLPETFAAYFAAVLAREVAFRLTNDLEMANRMEAKAAIFKQRAVWINSGEGYPEDGGGFWTETMHND